MVIALSAKYGMYGFDIDYIIIRSLSLIMKFEKLTIYE